MSDSSRFITGRLTAPDFALPEWAQGHLYVGLRQREPDPAGTLLSLPMTGANGTFQIPADDMGKDTVALVAVGWGEALNPVLANFFLPEDRAAQDSLDLGWDGSVTVIGYVEQMHWQQVGELPLAVMELVGYAVPPTYRRLPPLPLPAIGDRHGLHTDHPDNVTEQVYYLLTDAESPLAAAAQDALVSSLRVVCTASLGTQEARWYEIVNLPLVLDALTLIGP